MPLTRTRYISFLNDGLHKNPAAYFWHNTGRTCPLSITKNNAVLRNPRDGVIEDTLKAVVTTHLGHLKGGAQSTAILTVDLMWLCIISFSCIDDSHHCRSNSGTLYVDKI